MGGEGGGGEEGAGVGLSVQGVGYCLPPSSFQYLQSDSQRQKEGVDGMQAGLYK